MRELRSYELRLCSSRAEQTALQEPRRVCRGIAREAAERLGMSKECESNETLVSHYCHKPDVILSRVLASIETRELWLEHRTASLERHADTVRSREPG